MGFSYDIANLNWKAEFVFLLIGSEFSRIFCRLLAIIERTHFASPVLIHKVSLCCCIKSFMHQNSLPFFKYIISCDFRTHTATHHSHDLREIRLRVNTSKCGYGRWFYCFIISDDIIKYFMGNIFPFLYVKILYEKLKNRYVKEGCKNDPLWTNKWGWR